MAPNSPVPLEALVPARPRATGTRRRWQVLFDQLQAGHEPCFQTDRRHACPEAGCPWRAECGALRAEWRR